MRILALDLGKFKTVACDYRAGVVGAGGDRHDYVTLATTPAAVHDLLVEREPGLVVIEACSIMGWVADLCAALGRELIVANTNDARWSWKQVKRKTDRDDALKLARLAALNQLNPVHVPAAGVRQWRALIAHRHKLKDERTRVKNAIRAVLDGQALPWPVGAKGWTAAAVARLHELAWELAACGPEELWRGQLHVHLQHLEMTAALLAQVEAKLNAIAAAHPQVRRLQTMPNIGVRTAEVLVACLDQPRRFGSARQVSCYVGLTPRQFQSGASDRQGRISKRGPHLVRRLLLNVAWGMTRQCDQARALFDRVGGGQKTRRKKAAVAVGRKILISAWAMMRDEADWDPKKMGALAAVTASVTPHPQERFTPGSMQGTVAG